MPTQVLQQAYGLLRIKNIDQEQRTVTGIATTPEPDRMGDVVESLGISFRNPVPLLLFHKADKPVGQVHFEPPTADGMAFRATLPTIAEPGALRDRIEEAWQSLKAKLIAGVSIGFVPTVEPTWNKATGGFTFTKSEVLELSLVTIPANAGASIQTIKSLDLAASGRPNLPSVMGAFPERKAMTTQEQITSFEQTRTTKQQAMTGLMSAAAADGTTLDAAQTEQYDGLDAEVRSIDAHLVRLRAFDELNKAAAKPIAPAPVAHLAPVPPVIQVKSQLPAGTAFVRMVCARVVCRGNNLEAAEYARRWQDSTPEVALALKAAVAAGNTTDPAWASPLVQQNIAAEFIELLRPATIIGKIPGLRHVPPNTKVPAQTAGGTYGWVGEAKPKPLTALAFSSVTLPIAKAAGIIVITEELARLSTPSAEAIVRADMIAGIAQFLDGQFIDPAVALVANVHPASITNGLTPIASTDNALSDLVAILSALSGNNIPLAGVTLIMSETNGLMMGLARDSLGNRLFPSMGASGGTAEGISVVTSNTAGTNVIALQPSRVLIADDGGVSIDVSREASLQMDSAPASPADATTVLVSLWQNNLIGLRAERFINWLRLDALSVALVTGATYSTTVNPAGLAAGRTPPEPPRRASL